MKELWLDRRKTRLILLSSLFFLLAAHLYRWVNTMYSHDSLLIIQDDWVPLFPDPRGLDPYGIHAEPGHTDGGAVPVCGPRRGTDPSGGMPLECGIYFSGCIFRRADLQPGGKNLYGYGVSK